MSRSYCQSFQTALNEGTLEITRADKLNAKRQQRTDSRRSLRAQVDDYYAGEASL